MRRVSNKEKELMRKLRDDGSTFKEISRIVGFNESTIQYHISEKQKQNTINRVKRNPKIWKGKKEYMSNYMRNRYTNDEEFRERVKKHARESWRRKNSTK